MNIFLQFSKRFLSFSVFFVGVYVFPQATITQWNFDTSNLTPSTSSCTADVFGTWSSDNTSVATVDANGLITAHQVGTAQISYTVPGAHGCPDAVVTETVTVLAPPLTSPILPLDD